MALPTPYCRCCLRSRPHREDGRDALAKEHQQVLCHISSSSKGIGYQHWLGRCTTPPSCLLVTYQGGSLYKLPLTQHI